MAEDRELRVGHAHVCLVGLYVCRGDGLEFGGWGGVEEVMEDGEVEVVAGPRDEFFEVDFAY